MKPTPVVRSPIPWAGGKRWAVRHILPRIPEHVCYCEPFAGGLAVLLNKPVSKCEVINDTHDELIGFYRCVRFHHQALMDEMAGMLTSRTEFKAAIAQPGLTDIQRAARWFMRRRTCFGGEDTSFGVSTTGKPGGALNDAVQRIAELHARLGHVTIESLDWSRCLQMYDRPHTFFFIDPPYIGGAQSAYASFTIDDMRRLATAIRALKGRWMLTVNDSAELRDLFSFGKQTRLERANGISNNLGRTGRRYAELFVEGGAS